MTFITGLTGRRVLALGIVLALCSALLLGSALTNDSTAAARKAATKTINMRGAKANGKLKLFFQGPKSIREGDTLRIVSKTDGKNVGPHTFSLVTKAALPDKKTNPRKCFSPGNICFAIAKWQGAGPQGGVTINPAKAGKPGWDTEGDLSKTGDSWFSGSKPGNEFKQVVSAKAGTTLHYLCAIHPNMQGDIKVTPAG